VSRTNVPPVLTTRVLDGERPADARMFCDRMTRLLRRGLKAGD
jgi:hypothetical protein